MPLARFNSVIIFHFETTHLDLQSVLGIVRANGNISKEKVMSQTATMDEVYGFLDYTEEKGFLNKNTALSRKTASKKLAAILEPTEQSPEFMRDNLPTIKGRFQNLNQKVTGATIEEYARRLKLVLTDFFAWKQDRAKWEREVTGRGANVNRATPQGNTKKKESHTVKTKSVVNDNAAATNPNPDSNLYRRISFPIRPGTEIAIELPSDLITMEELQRIGLYLLPYCKDFASNKFQKTKFPALSVQEE